MKEIGILIGLIILISFIFFSCNKKSEYNSNFNQQDSIPQRKMQPDSNKYQDLRELAFNISPKDLGLTLSSDKIIVYGIIMDWGIKDGVATLVAFQSGDASVYLSSGGGVIGGGQHQNVSDAAKKFTTLAQRYIGKAAIAENKDLPNSDFVIFYFLTNNGIYKGEYYIKKSSIWMDLFNKGNKVLTELRLTSNGDCP